MLVAMHQLHYLPWLRYFEKIARADVFVVLDNIQFNKNGWQNRNRIKSASGAMLLTVPVQQKFAQRLDEVRINNNLPWRRKHWHAIAQHYAHAPYFREQAPFLESVYTQEWELLNELNKAMFDYFLSSLDIKTHIVYSSDIPTTTTASERLLEIMRAVDGDAYYTGAYATQTYLDAALFEKAGIRLVIQDWKAPRYPQLHGDFVPDLSILDLLLHCGPESLKILLEGCP